MTNTGEIIRDLGKEGYYYTITSKDCRLNCPAGRDYYVFLYVLRGKIKLQLNGKDCVMEEFSYGIVRNSDTCVLTDQADKTMLFTLFLDVKEMEKAYAFYGEDIRKYLEKSPEFLSVSGDFNAKLKIEELYERILLYGDEDRILCKNFAMEIFMGIVRRMHRQNKHDEIPREMVNAMTRMKETENLIAGVPAMERLTGYSRAQLCRLVKKYYGKTPHEYVEELRLNAAYNMIKYSDIDIKIISENVGFTAISWFYKLFKRQYGQTPIELRQSRIE